MTRLLVFVPTYGRPDIALKQAAELSRQIESQNSKNVFDIHLHLRVNSDNNYRQSDFYFPRCSMSFSDFNEGADSNISFGFYMAKKDHFDYLWIVGDDESLSANVIESIVTAISNNPEAQAVIGSKKHMGKYRVSKSLLRMNEDLGRTLSFISSTIYKVNYEYSLHEKSFLFSYSSYSHLAMQHNLVSLGIWKYIFAIDIQLICDYHQKVLADPLKPRASYGIRDSRVFFGKPLSALATSNKKYIDQEFHYWWKLNWHRISMYLDREEPNGWAFLGYSLTSIRNLGWILLSILPYWKLKDILNPISSPREVENNQLSNNEIR